jgi:hypothetical protein
MMMYLELFSHFLDCTIDQMSLLVTHENYKASKSFHFLFKQEVCCILHIVIFQYFYLIPSS